MQIHVWGGDGSMSWIASSIDALDLNLKCILCPNPLGTGNDLCQELKWGAKMTSQNLQLLKHFSKCNSAETINLDMWSVKITPSILSIFIDSFFLNFYKSIVRCEKR